MAATVTGPRLGGGIYTTPDIARILHLDAHAVRRWIREYFDLRLATSSKVNYSWSDGKSKAVDFHTLIEIFTMFKLTEAGVRTQKILDAHDILSKKFDSPYPFALSYVLNGLSTDGKKIYLNESDLIWTVDSTNQLNLKFIGMFFKKLDFDSNELAMRFWPLGKDHKIVVDPSHYFGQPIIEGTNIVPETVCNMVRGGDSKELISSLFDLTSKQVEDALTYCNTAA